MIYFMQATDGGPVKIGVTEDVDRRRCQLERAYGRPLAILATIPGEVEIEREIHARFAHLRLGRTEQFRPEPDLMTFIGRPLFVSANPVVEPMDFQPPPDQRTELIAVRCRPKFKAWVTEFAKHQRITPTQLVDLGLAMLARERGFEEPPER